jgi:hypothetical protein
LITFDLELELLRDAEPGTGLGTEVLDGVVPRDDRGLPVIPASHLKGVLRNQLESIASWIDLGAVGPNRLLPVLDALLGRGGEDGGDGQLGRFRTTDLRSASKAGDRATMEIRRTALGALGTALSGSLRTTEAVRAGMSFRGRVHLDAGLGDPLDLACRLGLMSIEAVGGSRTRGAGLCRIQVVGETRTPGALLQALELALARMPADPGHARVVPVGPRKLTSRQTSWFRLAFVADDPVCCPETPTIGSNVIRSGPVIPASAVQGALLTLLNNVEPALASGAYADSSFRAWPLTPIAAAADSGDGTASGFGVRVDLSHRMSKLVDDRSGGHLFFDSAIAPYAWSDAPAGSSLKSSDGVLVRGADGHVGLWRAQDLPRILRAHGVHNGPDGMRNLFTVEALAPLAYSGLLAIPAEAGKRLQELLLQGGAVCFGKARSVRGGGRLSLISLDAGGAPWSWRLPAAQQQAEGRVFIVQSPLALPDEWQIDCAEEALARLVRESGWGELQLGDPEGRGRHGGSAATIGLRFGWNRHGLGDVVGQHRRLRAKRVILPGSVVVLRRALSNIEQRLLEGLGAGREQGFGALLPHPGVATVRLPRSPELPELRSEPWAEFGLRLWRDAGGDSGPSASQIGALAQRVARGGAAARGYLEQLHMRPPRIWDVWKTVRDTLLQELGNPNLGKALRAWHDLRVGMEAADRKRSNG